MRDLKILQEGMGVVERGYRLTADWPRAEIHSLTSQARRTLVSLLANAAEGASRKSLAERGRFSRIPLGLRTAHPAGVESPASVDAPPTVDALALLTKRLNRFIQYQEAKK